MSYYPPPISPTPQTAVAATAALGRIPVSRTTLPGSRLPYGLINDYSRPAREATCLEIMILRANFFGGVNVDKREIYQLMSDRLDELEELLKLQAEYLRKLREERDYFQTEHRISMEKCARLEVALKAARSNHLPISHIPGRLAGVDFLSLDHAVRKR